jgi:hypothetical protein
VRHVSHWIVSGPGFFEPLRTAQSFQVLPDPAFVVWTRKSASRTRIPFRGDELKLALAAGHGALEGLDSGQARSAALLVIIRAMEADAC